jgi:poly(glycerol-phosphate) alpha-glucosyltransferase
MQNKGFSAKQKLENETAAFKGIIYGLIGERNFEAAEQILGRYETVMPKDPEINQIRSMINLAKADELDAGVKKTGAADRAALLGKTETVFITQNLFPTRNGIMTSILNTVKNMENLWGYSPLILVCDRNIELFKIRMMLKSEDNTGSKLGTNNDTRIVSVYEHYQKSYTEGLEPRAVYYKSNSGERYVEVGPGVHEVYDGDEMVRKEFFTGYKGSLRLIERYKDGKMTAGVLYDDWGYVSSIIKNNPEDDTHFDSENFYTVDNRLCIKVLYKYEEGEQRIDRLILYDENGDVSGEFKDNAGLAAEYLNQTLGDSKFYILVVEDGLYAEAATTLERKNAANTIVVHSTIFYDPYDPYTSEPQKYYKYLCDNRDKFDGVIFLTHDERRDFNYRYGNIRSTFVIPHAYPHDLSFADFDKRDHRKAVIIARFDPLKRIDFAIDIFADAVKKLPDIKLEIYGADIDGEREKYEKRIKKLGMENNVFLKGFTDDPVSVLKTSAAFMMTSGVEGFGLTLIESICNGCPAFAFDIKHGPSEIINDGITGYLIPRFDGEMYTKKLIGFFEDTELQRAMSENAYAEAPRFGPEAFLENWYGMIKTLYTRKSAEIGGDGAHK